MATTGTEPAQRRQTQLRPEDSSTIVNHEL
jgi:hypothetical protein